MKRNDMQSLRGGSVPEGRQFPVRKLALLAALAVLLGSCSRAKPGPENTEAMVYYIAADGISLTGREYVPGEQNFEGILAQVLSEFQNPSYADVASALPQGVGINRTTMGVDNLTVDFDAGYLTLTSRQRLLLQAALVKTLVYLPGVRYVTLTVDGQSITDMDGSVIGALDDDSFIMPGKDGIL